MAARPERNYTADIRSSQLAAAAAAKATAELIIYNSIAAVIHK